MPASLQDVCERDEVGLHVVVGVVYAVANPGLGREVNDAVEVVLRETGCDLGAIGKVCPRIRRSCKLLPVPWPSLPKP